MIIDRPIRYMEARVASGPPRLYSALLPVIIHAFVSAGGSAILQARLMRSTSAGLPDPIDPTAAVVISLLLAVPIGLAGLALHAAVMFIFDMTTAESTGARRWRLVELAGLAYWPQLLWSVPALIALWWLFDPPAMTLGVGGADDSSRSALRYVEWMENEPLLLVMRQIQPIAGVWLVALHAMALRVVSGFTVFGAWMAGVIMAVLFVAVPTVVTREVIDRVLF